MNIKKLAKDLISDAEYGLKKDITTMPCILYGQELLNQQQYLELKDELAKQNYSIVDLKDAPDNYNLVPLKNKYFIFKN